MCRSFLTPAFVRRQAQLNALWGWASFWQAEAHFYGGVAEAVRQQRFTLLDEYHAHRDEPLEAQQALEQFHQHGGTDVSALSPLGARCRTLRETVARILEDIDFHETKWHDYWDLADDAREKPENAFAEWRQRRSFVLRAEALGRPHEESDESSD